jgi:glutamate synthase (NADPH/NADH) small chain
MGDPRGFLKLPRVDRTRRPVSLRVLDWRELYEPPSEELLKGQGARCMDCGVPFCQGDTGCPVQNLIPEWNDLVFRGRWQEALTALHATNNFPEFTGRLCPAPCEGACVLGIIDDPVSIKSIEQSIIDRGFQKGWVHPLPPERETGKRVAVIGSGPAGLAAAQQLRRMGHQVTVFEKDDRIGGLLRYGIPEFKMEKWVLERRLDQMRAEGVEFRTGVDVGVDLTMEQLREQFDAVCLAGGAQQARDLPVPGRELAGVHLAMEYLTQQNRETEGDPLDPAQRIHAAGKRVVVIGGGDTGSDCVGTAHRQGAVEVVQLELLPQPPEHRAEETPWPFWPMMLRTSHAHEEGAAREWSIMTRSLSGENGQVRRLHTVRVEPQTGPDGRPRFQEIPGTEAEIETDLVILAMGFVSPVRQGLLEAAGVQLDGRGNVTADRQLQTSEPGVFVAGDMHRGASLIVWAIREGRDAAAAIDRYLRGAGAEQPRRGGVLQATA